MVDITSVISSITNMLQCFFCQRCSSNYNSF